MNTVISKAPRNKEFVQYKVDNASFRAIPLRSVTIMGGAGIANPKTLVIPEGVATEVSDDALDWLETNDEFKMLVEKGIYRVIKHKNARLVDADEEASSGKMIDNEDITARPLTPEQLKKDGATINKDGSVDITGGGKNAPQSIQLHIAEVQRKEAKKASTGDSSASTKKRGRKVKKA